MEKWNIWTTEVEISCISKPNPEAPSSAALFRKNRGELNDDEVFELEDILYSQQDRLHKTLRQRILGRKRLEAKPSSQGGN